VISASGQSKRRGEEEEERERERERRGWRITEMPDELSKSADTWKPTVPVIPL